MIRPIILIAALLSLAACETIKGAGKDMQQAGAAVQTEAAQAQSDM